MASFALEPGEQLLHRERVRNARDHSVACELILTDRRVVLTAVDAKPSAWMMLGVFSVLGALFDHRKTFVSHEVRRERFESVERTGKRDVKVASTGELYGRTWFEFTTKEADVWIDRLHVWAANGTSAPLPPARVI